MKHSIGRLQSIGSASALFQKDPRELLLALRAVQAEATVAAGGSAPQEAVPALVLDEVMYFATDDVIAAVEWLNTNKNEDRRK